MSWHADIEELGQLAVKAVKDALEDGRLLTESDRMFYFQLIQMAVSLGVMMPRALPAVPPAMSEELSGYGKELITQVVKEVLEAQRDAEAQEIQKIGRKEPPGNPVAPIPVPEYWIESGN